MYFRKLPPNNYVKNVVNLLGAAINEGQAHHPGVAKAPEEIRQNGLTQAIRDLSWTLEDQGDVSSSQLKKEYGPGYSKDIINIHQLGDLLNLVYQKTRKSASDKCFALTIGGDHSVSTGTISALKSVYPNLKVLWVHAYSDCVIPEFATTGKYKNYHGMTTSHLMGLLDKASTPNFEWMPKREILQPEDFCHLGIRDIDYDEKEHLINFGMKYFTCDHITRYGIGETVEKCIQYLKADKNPVHICFDINAVDPEFAPGTSTKCREGLDYREALYICRRLRSTLNLVGFDILEVNPDLDVNRTKYFGDNSHLKGKQTLWLASELVLACLGRRFLPFRDI